MVPRYGTRPRLGPIKPRMVHSTPYSERLRDFHSLHRPVSRLSEMYRHYTGT